MHESHSDGSDGASAASPATASTLDRTSVARALNGGIRVEQFARFTSLFFGNDHRHLW